MDDVRRRKLKRWMCMIPVQDCFLVCNAAHHDPGGDIWCGYLYSPDADDFCLWDPLEWEVAVAWAKAKAAHYRNKRKGSAGIRIVWRGQERFRSVRKAKVGQYGKSGI